LFLALQAQAVTPPSDGCFRDQGDWGVPLAEQKELASTSWKYEWSEPPYGTAEDIAGVLQLVNGGNETMWIRYGGGKIGSGGAYEWKSFIQQASALNGFNAHKWNELNTNGMVGQGDGFKLEPGEYQILPFAGASCWSAATLGCDENGANCAFAPLGRGGADPNALFEWTTPGMIWDGSAVDGFGAPFKVEVDRVPEGFDSQIFLEFDAAKCTNKVLDSAGRYHGCKSMCACQASALAQGVDQDPDCPGMANVSTIINNPPMGYCGCHDDDYPCSEQLNHLFEIDPAGKKYCDSITEMAAESDGNRAVYCQAYDDKSGTQNNGNGVLKVTFCNKGFENLSAKHASVKTMGELRNSTPLPPYV